MPSPEEIAKQIAAIQTMIDTFCVAPPIAIGDPYEAIGGPVSPTNSTDPVTGPFYPTNSTNSTDPVIPAKPMTMLEMIMNQWNTAKDKVMTEMMNQQEAGKAMLCKRSQKMLAEYQQFNSLDFAGKKTKAENWGDMLKSTLNELMMNGAAFMATYGAAVAVVAATISF